MERVATDGTLANVESVPSEVRRVFVCAHDVAAEGHVRMQAAFQKHCDASISKTINFPEHATIENISAIYGLAYDLNCKGVTVYRDGCRQHQPMALKNSEKTRARTADKTPETEEYRPLQPAVLPEIATGVRVRQLTPFGNMHINITLDPRTERELEVFAQLGKGGDLANSDLEAICRMVSLWLRAGGSLDHVIQQLRSIGSSLQVHTKEGKIMSLGDGLARALQRYQQAKVERGLRGLLLGEVEAETTSESTGAEGAKEDGHGPKGGGNGRSNGNGRRRGRTAGSPVSAPAPSRLEALGFQWQQKQYKVICPDCRNPLRFSEGCVTCDACGFSKC